MGLFRLASGAKCEQLGPYVEDAARKDPAARELERMWHAEGLVLQVKINALRQKFAGVLDDVVGIAEITPDMLCEYWPGARVFGEKKSIKERRNDILTQDLQ